MVAGWFQFDEQVSDDAGQFPPRAGIFRQHSMRFLSSFQVPLTSVMPSRESKDARNGFPVMLLNRPSSTRETRLSIPAMALSASVTLFASAAAYDGNIEFILCYLHFFTLNSVPCSVPSACSAPASGNPFRLCPLNCYVRLIDRSFPFARHTAECRTDPNIRINRSVKNQWWKRRSPVKAMTMPCLLHASITASSRTEPPG